MNAEMEDSSTEEEVVVKTDPGSLTIKVDVTLTREQVRNYLGAQVVDQDNMPDKITIAVIRELIRSAVQSHVMTATMNWDLLATEEQVRLVDEATAKIMR